ncbi:VacB/RNase II family 3'-5' exoribonuclease [Campylobacter fetus subsp. fetus]|uniref:RNB domain-containing ribonuclease n=1 Tax=Campylobacter fetus TaxID=196 RepID=UPI00143D79D8|nr:ribonuclease R family protein [Campylobacter fetus]MBC3779922.1 VacB/RNase II family 3'-5' exoribonuclease [Campylobacter fetus subsp. fetus]MBC3783246.1 VacB/RNase II family 3'-5' exoribonuclease [Campylobacter fetus subsp. venerealis]
MKEFLNALVNGVDDKFIKIDEREILRVLEQIKAVKKHKNKYYLNDGYVCGKLDISSGGTGFLMPYDVRFKQDIIIENRDLNGAHFGDIVLSKLTKSKKSRLHATMIAVLAMANETSVVYTKQFGQVIMGVSIPNSLTIALKASQKSLKELPIGTVLKINNLDNDITEVLGVLSDPSVDEKISLAIYNKKNLFPKICENKAKSFGDNVDKSMYPNRVDLTNLPFCTIDPVDAKDFDDAIYYDVKNRTVYVAIADVSEYVAAYSGIDKEAKFRGFSIYFPHIAIPMLPRSLSENICSLKPNCDRLAFVFKISLDENLESIKEELFEAVIHSRKRFNYDEVDEILALNLKTDDEIQEWILPLFETAKKLKFKRLQNGFDFRSKELRMSISTNGDILKTTYEKETPSHSLIEDCMLLANKAAAKRINHGIFRNHAPADLKKINTLLDDLAALGIEITYESDLVALISKIQTQADSLNIREDVDKLIIKAQKRAEYASKPTGHFGLGFDLYSHFTSPIRRYSDLILHRLLKANLENNAKLFNYLLLDIEGVCRGLNELEREADRVAWDFMDRKFARWATNNINKVFRCYISEVGNQTIAKLDDEIKGARIYIENFTCSLLASVMVQIKEVDIPSAKIIGKVVQKLDV